MWDFVEDIMDRQGVAEYFNEIVDAFSQTADGRYVYICDIAKDFSFWSREAVEYFGLPGPMIHGAGNIWAEHIEPESRQRYLQEIHAIFRGEQEKHDMIYRAKKADGQYVTCTCKGNLIRDKRGNPKFFAGTIVNHETNETIDPVTGLSSLNNLMDAMARFTRKKKPYYLLMVGITNFFDVNSTYGYAFGNKVLKECSEYSLAVKKDGKVFRCEGVKTAFLLEAEGHSIDDLQEIFHNLRDCLQSKVYVDNIHVAMDICGGAIFAEDFSMDANAVYNSALYALSKAKEENRADLSVFNNSIFIDNSRKLEILSTIRNSITDGFDGFYLCYQPIVSAKTEMVTGMEALLRWKNDKYGVVPPNSFIPWLERDPIFFELGNWILHRAMQDAKKIMQTRPDFIVNVNLAYPQLQRADFKATLNRILEEENFPSQNLKLELTERCRLLDIEMLRNDMIFFKSTGMQTALDDFGTGYSALNLLAELPVDQIKIDRSFITNIETDIPKQSLLRAITSCARELGKHVCVEGIETEGMKDYIKMRFPVTSFQGYYYSRPIPIEEFRVWLENYS